MLPPLMKAAEKLTGTKPAVWREEGHSRNGKRPRLVERQIGDPLETCVLCGKMITVEAELPPTQHGWYKCRDVAACATRVSTLRLEIVNDAKSLAARRPARCSAKGA